MWITAHTTYHPQIDLEVMYLPAIEGDGESYHVFDTDTGIDYCLSLRTGPQQVKLVIASVHGTRPLLLWDDAAIQMWHELAESLPHSDGLKYFMDQAREQAGWVVDEKERTP